MTVKRITLWLLGGMTEMDDNPPAPKADLVIAASGPMTSLLLGGVCLGTVYLVGAAVPPLVVAGLVWLGVTNVVLAVFNLLPGTPLDGGRVLRAVVWWRTGDRARAVAVASRAGRLLGGALIVLGLAGTLAGWLTGLWLAMLGWFLIAAAQAEVRGDLVRQRLGDLRVRDIMDPRPTPAPGWWTVEKFLEETAGEARRRVFPVVSFDGQPIGVLSLAELARLDPQTRMTTRVADACRRPPRFVAPDQRVVDVLTAPLRPGDLLLVLDGGHLVGVVDAGDIARAIDLAMAGGRHVPARS